MPLPPPVSQSQFKRTHTANSLFLLYIFAMEINVLITRLIQGVAQAVVVLLQLQFLLQVFFLVVAVKTTQNAIFHKPSKCICTCFLTSFSCILLRCNKFISYGRFSNIFKFYFVEPKEIADLH